MDETVFNASRLASCPGCDVEGNDDDDDDGDDDDDDDFFFFFLGYRGIAYSPSARSCRRRQTNLICARTAA